MIDIYSHKDYIYFIENLNDNITVNYLKLVFIQILNILISN